MGDAQALLKETEKLLEKWKHPDPYVHPTAPGGAHFYDCVLNRQFTELMKMCRI
jgi:hypothetical protein